MRYLLILLSVLTLLGCENFPEEKATKVGTGEYEDFKSSLYLEYPQDYAELYETADGARVARTVVDRGSWMDTAEVEAQLSYSKVFIMSESGTKEICYLADDVCDKSPVAGCLYPYDKSPKVIVNINTARKEPFVRMKIACHEYLHEAIYKETFRYDHAHETQEIWQKQSGKDSVEYRCAEQALMLR